jgi:flagellar hook-length control protein FliK
VRMTLNPPELGRIDIQLSIQDGIVSGAISASDSAVIEQLARDINQLRQSFVDAGLKLGDQGISLMLNNNPQQQSGQHGQGQNSQGPAWQGDDAARDLMDLATPAAAWVAPDRLVDVRI